MATFYRKSEIPPHLKDYFVPAELGLEPTPDAYVARLVEVFREVRRVLREDGTVWLNLGDSYAGGGGFSPDSPSNQRGSKQTTQKGAIKGAIGKPQGLKSKDLIGIPWRVAFALQVDGWYLRQDIIWHKPNPMPESVRDRCTKAHEYVFLLSKSARYYYDQAAIAEESTGRASGNLGPNREPGWRDGDNANIRGSLHKFKPTENRNRRSVWTIATQPFSESHFAVMPPALAELCIKAGCPEDGTVLDPFGGAGTTGLVADRLQRNAVLIELNPDYADLARTRIHGDCPLFAEGAS